MSAIRNHHFLPIIITIFLFACSKEKVETLSSDTGSSGVNDISKYTGSWSFTVNNDPNTLYSGKIYRYNDSTLNVHYQPEDLMVAGDNYFKQLTLPNTNEGKFKMITIPLGNTGGWIKKEGTISTSTFTYTENRRDVHYVTGEETFSTKTISGTKVN